MKTLIGTRWRENITTQHRKYRAQPAVVVVLAMVSGWKGARVRVEKLTGRGSARFRVMHVESLRAKFTEVPAVPVVGGDMLQAGRR